MDNNFTVYIHHNLTNHKVYVGITSQDPEIRWKKGWGYDHNPHLTNAFKKYGWNGFEHIIVGTYLSKESACEIEKELIELYKSDNYEFGYNSSSGGEISGYKHGLSGTKEYQDALEERLHDRILLQSQARDRLKALQEKYDLIKDNEELLKQFLENIPILKQCKNCNCIFKLDKNQSNRKIYCPECSSEQNQRDRISKSNYKSRIRNKKSLAERRAAHIEENRKAGLC